MRIEDIKPKMRKFAKMRFETSESVQGKLYRSHDLYRKHQRYFGGEWTRKIPGYYPVSGKIKDVIPKGNLIGDI